jgi:predicted transcriptional regulator
VSERAPQNGAGGLDPAEIHDVLRNDRRRLVLQRLRDRTEDQPVRELAEYVAGVEAGETPPPRNVRQSVYVSLHQTHLPKLDELGIVEYDAESKDVRLAEHADEVTVYMEVVPKYGLSWGEYYLGLGLFGGLSILGKLVGVPGLAGVDGVVLAGALVALVLGSALYHVGSQRTTLLERIPEWR